MKKESNQYTSKRLLLKLMAFRLSAWALPLPSLTIAACGGGDGSASSADRLLERKADAQIAASTAAVVHDIPLTHSLAAIVGPAVSFENVGKGSVVDCYGSLQITNNREARFMGARRVCNLVPDDIFWQSWIKGSGVVKELRVDLVGPYLNRKNVFQFKIRRLIGPFLINQFRPERTGQHTVSIWMGSARGSRVRMEIADARTLAVLSSTIIELNGGSLQRYAIASIVTGGVLYNWSFYLESGVSEIQLTCPQVEHTNGQTGAPNDYVPRGSLDDAAPWGYAGVDGVRYFNTTNPWSMSGNIAVLGTGNPIDPTTLKGLLIGPSRANAFKQSRDIGLQSWNLQNTVTTADKLTTLLLGPQSMTKLHDTASAGFHRFLQSWSRIDNLPPNEAMITVSFFVTSAERRNISIGFFDKNGIEKHAIVNILTEQVIFEQGDVCKTHITRISDLLRISFTDKAGIGAGVPVGFGGLVNDEGLELYQPVVQGGAYFGGLAFEKTDHACLYLGDTGTGTPAGIGAEVASFDFSPSMNMNDWTVSVDCTTMYDSDSPTKSSWSFIWYATKQSNIRWGCAIRPGAYGGAAVEDYIGHPMFDCYAGPDGLGVPQINPLNGKPQEIFDVANLQMFAPAMQTNRWQVALHPVAIDQGSNIAMYVGNTKGVLESNGHHIVSRTPSGVKCMLGARAKPIDEKMIKNIYVLNKARTWSEMALSAL